MAINYPHIIKVKATVVVTFYDMHDNPGRGGVGGDT